jgi:hypothetical protein
MYPLADSDLGITDVPYSDAITIDSMQIPRHPEAEQQRLLQDCCEIRKDMQLSAMPLSKMQHDLEQKSVMFDTKIN